MLIPLIAQQNRPDVITPDFLPSEEQIFEPTVVGITPPVRSEGATWTYVLGGGGGGVANDECDTWDDDRRELACLLRDVARGRTRRSIRRAARRANTALPQRVVHPPPRYDLSEYQDLADVIEMDEDELQALEREDAMSRGLVPVPTQALATVDNGASLAEIGGFIAAASASFAITYATGQLARRYLEHRAESLPVATGPIGVAGVVTAAALLWGKHRAAVAVGAGLAALVVIGRRRKKPKAKSKTRKRARKR